MLQTLKNLAVSGIGNQHPIEMLENVYNFVAFDNAYRVKGSPYIAYRDVPAVSDPKIGNTWKPADVLTALDGTRKILSDKRGEAALSRRLVEDLWCDAGITPRQLCDDIAEGISSDSVPVFVSSQFAQMWIEAAQTIPDTTLSADMLPAKKTVFIFSEPIEVFDEESQSRIFPETEEGELASIRMFSVRNEGDVAWVDTFLDGPAVDEYIRQHNFLSYATKETFFFPTPAASAWVPLSGNKHTIPEAYRSLNQLLTAFMPLLESQMVDKTSVRVQKPQKKHREHTPSREVTVVSLMTPEYTSTGSAETGQHHRNRAHWVRGFWRKQWYPSKQEHRPKWVDGFMRGDPSLGIVTSKKIYKV